MITTDKKALIAMGRGTASLHEIIFRGYANNPATINLKTRLLAIADRYHRIATDNPDGKINTVEGEGPALETLRGLAGDFDRALAFVPVWFVVNRYAIDNGAKRPLKDGFPTHMQHSTLYELHLELVKYKMTLPAGAWDWFGSAGVGDYALYNQVLGPGVDEVTELNVFGRED